MATGNIKIEFNSNNMKEYKITEEQIKEVHKWLKAEFKEPFEFLFPECFKSNECKIGVWYKSEEAIVNYQKGSNCYGFLNNEWLDKKNNWIVGDKFGGNNWLQREATESEVFEMLKKEAEKKGLVNGVTVVSPVDGGKYKIDGNFRLSDSDNSILTTKYVTVLYKGKWATIVETPKEMTLEEIEKQLGHKVKIVS